MRVAKIQIKEDQLKWSAAPDYAAVLRLNCQYFRGQMMTTPYNHRPIDRETDPGPNLIRLHDYGILVYGWQSDEHSNPTHSGEDSEHGDLDAEDGETLFQEVQKRDFLHFLIPLGLFSHDALQVFWMSLIAHPAVVTRIVCRREATLCSGKTKSPNVTVSSNLGGESYPIVRHRAASTVDELKHAEYRTLACVPPDPVVLDHAAWNCHAISSALPQEFWVITKAWDGALQVAALIEDLALAAGLKMIYAEGNAGDVGSDGMTCEDEI